MTIPWLFRNSDVPRADRYFSWPAVSTIFNLKSRSRTEIRVTLISLPMVTTILRLNISSRYREIRDDFPTFIAPRTKSWIVGRYIVVAFIFFCTIGEDCNRSIRIRSSAQGLLELSSSIQRKTISLSLFFPIISISCLRRSFSGIWWPSVQQKNRRTKLHVVLRKFKL